MTKMIDSFENIMHPGPVINPKCYSFRVRVRWRLG